MIYESVIQPVPLYGAKLWTLRNKTKRMLATTEMKILGRIKEITLLDRQKNEDICASLKVNCILEKAQQALLRWYGHLLRLKGENQVRKTNLEDGDQKKEAKNKTP